MSIITRTGDSGNTKLMYGQSVSKSDLRVEAYGTIDELNSFLGMARALCDDENAARTLESLQRESFIVGGELATPPEKLEKLQARVSSEMTARLDEIAGEIEAIPGLLDDWALPGATKFGAAVDVARVVARRAERCVVRLAREELVPNAEILRYMNRLSDVLWLVGRKYEIERGADGALRSD